MNVRHWKLLERHPISAEYADLSGQAYVDFEQSMRQVGYLPDKPVVIYEGKVLDGWQRFRAAKALDIKPTFVALPKDLTPEEYVSAANDHRRHMSQETARIMAEKRRERVLRARLAGQSLRKIAKEEGVSVGTIHNDVTVQGEQCAPPDGKVSGLDGRRQPATRPQEVGDANEDDGLLCDRCVRVGPATGCAKCKEVREKHAAKKAKRKGPKQGAAHFERKVFDQGIGIVTRQVDALAKHYGAKESKWHTGLLAEVKELKAAFDDRLALLKKAV